MKKKTLLVVTVTLLLLTGCGQPKPIAMELVYRIQHRLKMGA
jgi:uncharacterized protein YcfL